MARAAAMRETMTRYLELVAAGDVDGVVDLMAEEVSVEDPVGGPDGTHVVGRDNVRAFFAVGFANSQPHPVRTGPICVTAANEAAMSFRLTLTLRGEKKEIDVIDTMTFDADGKIESLRAFWSFADIRDAP